MNANLTFHVVGVGGGIAGLVAADSLTGQEISVAVIEKDRAFGNFVVCGEAVQKWVVEELGFQVVQTSCLRRLKPFRSLTRAGESLPMW